MAEGRRKTRGLRSKSIALMRQRIQRGRAVVEGRESYKIIKKKSVGGLAVLHSYWIDFEMRLNRQGDCIKYWASRISCLTFPLSFISLCTEQDDTDLQRLRHIWESKVVPVIYKSNKTSSKLCLRNMGVERNYNSETVSLREENSKKNIRIHKRKSNMEN